MKNLLLLSLALAAFAPVTVAIDTPIDNYETPAVQVGTQESFAQMVITAAPQVGGPVVFAKDTTFNPRTDFPQKQHVMTAGFGLDQLQECCGGNGSWNYADRPVDLRLWFILLSALAGIALAQFAHFYDRRTEQHRKLATN